MRGGERFFFALESPFGKSECSSFGGRFTFASSSLLWWFLFAGPASGGLLSSEGK